MDKDFITLEETKDQLIGEVGTQKRDDYEEELRLYAIGAAIRQTRKLQNLTQEERISPRKNLAGWLVYRRHKSHVLRMVRT